MVFCADTSDVLMRMLHSFSSYFILTSIWVSYLSCCLHCMQHEIHSWRHCSPGQHQQEHTMQDLVMFTALHSGLYDRNSTVKENEARYLRCCLQCRQQKQQQQQQTILCCVTDRFSSFDVHEFGISAERPLETQDLSWGAVCIAGSMARTAGDVVFLDSIIRNSGFNTTGNGAVPTALPCAVNVNTSLDLRGVRFGLPSTFGWVPSDTYDGISGEVSSCHKQHKGNKEKGISQLTHLEK